VRGRVDAVAKTLSPSRFLGHAIIIAGIVLGALTVSTIYRRRRIRQEEEERQRRQHTGVGEKGPFSRWLSGQLGTYKRRSVVDVIRTAAGALTRLGRMMGRKIGSDYTMYSARAENKLYRAFGHISNIASIPGGWYSYIRYGAPTKETLEEASRYGIRPARRGGLYAPITEREVRRTLQTIQNMPEEVQHWLGARAEAGTTIEMYPQEFLFSSDAMSRPYRGITYANKGRVAVGARSPFGGEKPAYIFAHEIGHLLDLDPIAGEALSASPEFQRMADANIKSFRPYVRQRQFRRIKAAQYRELFAETFAGTTLGKASPYGVQPAALQRWVRQGSISHAKQVSKTLLGGTLLPHTGPGERSGTDVVKRLRTYKPHSTVDAVKAITGAIIKTLGGKEVRRIDRNIKVAYNIIKDMLPGITRERFSYAIKQTGKALHRLKTAIKLRGQNSTELTLTMRKRLHDGIIEKEKLPYTNRVKRLDQAINSPVYRSIPGPEKMATEMAYSLPRMDGYSFPVGAQESQLSMTRPKLLDPSADVKASKDIQLLTPTESVETINRNVADNSSKPTSNVNLKIVDAPLDVKRIDKELSRMVKLGWLES